MEQKKNLLVVNLFAGSGAGKSTISAGVFHTLKQLEVNCELVTEYAKDLVWDEAYKVLHDQLYIFAEQNHRLARLKYKVDVVITDSPIFLSLIYNKIYLNEGEEYSGHFEDFIKETFDRYDNLNYYLVRNKTYNPIGRMQNEAQAKEIDKQVQKWLDVYEVPYNTIEYNQKTVNTITNTILERIGK